MTESINDESSTGGPQASRPCGYSRCERRVAYAGAGRPREYCGPPDRVWPEAGGKTCKQLAAEERAAAKSAGLAGVLAGYAATEDPELVAIAKLTEALAERTAAGERVLQVVGERVAEAERLAAEAATARARAETERDTAVRQAQTATGEAEQAKEARRVAERMARDADAERQRQVDATWRTAMEYEAARAAAVERADAQANIAAHEKAQREREAARAEQLAAANKELVAENKTLGKELAAARAEAEAARVQAERDRQAADAAQAAARRELQDNRAEMARVREDTVQVIEFAERDRERMQAEIERLRETHLAQVAALQDAATEARARAEQLAAAADAERQRSERAGAEAAAARQDLAARDAELAEVRRQLDRASQPDDDRHDTSSQETR